MRSSGASASHVFDLRKTSLPLSIVTWYWSVARFRSCANIAQARDAIEQIDMTVRMVQSYPDTFQLVFEPEDVEKAYKDDKIACSIGIEGYVDRLSTKGNLLTVTGFIWPATASESLERSTPLACDT